MDKGLVSGEHIGITLYNLEDLIHKDFQMGFLNYGLLPTQL